MNIVYRLLRMFGSLAATKHKPITHTGPKNDIESFRAILRQSEEREYMFVRNLKRFLRLLGFDPHKIAELDLKAPRTVEAINALVLTRDFTGTDLSEKEVANTHKLLNSLMIAGKDQNELRGE